RPVSPQGIFSPRAAPRRLSPPSGPFPSGRRSGLGGSNIPTATEEMWPMAAHTRPVLRPACMIFTLCLGVGALGETSARAGPKEVSYWRVDDVQPGMKGTGRTVIKGTKLETFGAEVLGVLKNTSPGRDLVLCRLSGLDLEKTGVIAGMSGSPVYIDG